MQNNFKFYSKNPAKKSNIKTKNYYLYFHFVYEKYF